MPKKLIYVLMVIALLFITACKGQRSVKVKIIYPNQYWYGWMSADSTGTTIDVSGEPPIYVGIAPIIPPGIAIPVNFDTHTIDLGDDKSKITVWAMRLSLPPGGGPEMLEAQIVEEYQAGFLYLASSEVKADSSNNTNTVAIPVYASYDFGAKK